MNKSLVKINNDFIRLDDLLKFSGEVATGGQAKIMIQAGQIWLNGEVCTMRGKKLHSGDVVEVGENLYEVEEVPS